MAYERLIYENSNGGTVELSPYSIYHTNVKSDVKGLSDVAAEVHTVSSIGQDGSDYVNSYIKQREITITGYIHNLSRSEGGELRRELDRILNPHLTGYLHYIHDDYERVIECHPENAPVWDQSKVLPKYTIDLICPNPFWSSIGSSNTAMIVGWDPQWEFEIKIIENNFVFGNRIQYQNVDVTNDGDVACGMEVRFIADTGPVTNPELQCVTTGEFLRIKTTLQTGDVLRVKTGYGQKSAVIRRGDTDINVFRYLDTDSTFIQLPPGTTRFDSAASLGYMDMLCDIIWSNAYLGV